MIVLIVRNVEDGSMKSFGKQVSHAVRLFLWRQLVVRSNEFTYIDRLAELHTDSGTEPEEVTVSDTYRHDV